MKKSEKFSLVLYKNRIHNKRPTSVAINAGLKLMDEHENYSMRAKYECF